MKKISGDELKLIQLGILDAVVEFCDNNGIQYWLNAGTLLGAVRHKGYIPWDDDIDLGMKRKDYKRFCELFNVNNKRYQSFCIENDKKFFTPYAKVADMDTLLYEPDESGVKFYINIDIFPYDNAPDNFEDCKKIYKQQQRLRSVIEQKRTKLKPNGNIIVRVLKYSVRLLLKVTPESFLLRTMSNNAQRLNTVESNFTTDFTGYTWYYLKKDWIADTTVLAFEGKSYKVPICYDEYLKSMYGDYMRLPPLEKQITHHNFIAYR